MITCWRTLLMIYKISMAMTHKLIFCAKIKPVDHQFEIDWSILDPPSTGRPQRAATIAVILIHLQGDQGSPPHWSTSKGFIIFAAPSSCRTHCIQSYTVSLRTGCSNILRPCSHFVRVSGYVRKPVLPACSGGSMKTVRLRSSAIPLLQRRLLSHLLLPLVFHSFLVLHLRIII